MNKFDGFPPRMEFTPLPNLFFSTLLPQINSMAELKTTLHVLAMLYRKRSHPRFITYGELLRNTSLMDSLKDTGEPLDKALQNALKMAAERGTLLHIALDRDGEAEDAYFINTEANREILSKIKKGELKLGGLKPMKHAYVETESQPDIFTLYEENIGILTPMIAEELREAEKLYPQSWFRDAIREAVSLNKRNIRYIIRILENWSAEGRGDGTHRRDSKKDPDRFIKGKYGHMVQR